MTMQQHDDTYTDGIISRLVRAATALAAELGEARPLFDFERRGLVDAVARWLEGSDFSGRQNEANLEILRDLVTVELLQEVLGVTTTLEEIRADAGMVEYEIVPAPVFSARGDRFRLLEDALIEFLEVRRELEFVQKVERLKQTRGRH